MKVTIEDYSDSFMDKPEKTIQISSTENENFVTLIVGGQEYEVSISDLYRATLPFMDKREEERRSYD